MSDFNLYQKVVKALDSTYFKNTDYSMDINAIQKFLRPNSIGLDIFKKMNNIPLTENIDDTIADIIEDKIGYHKDTMKNEPNIITENAEPVFTEYPYSNYQETIANYLAENRDENYDKQTRALSDLYDVSLELISYNNNGFYTIDDENGEAEFELIVLNKTQLSDIINIILTDTVEFICNKSVMTPFMNIELDTLLGNFKEELKSSIKEQVSSEDEKQWISKIYDSYSFKTEKNDYLIWERKSVR